MTQTMTEPQTLNVEYKELMERADELEVAIAPPSDYAPHAPSDLPHATSAATQLANSAKDMRIYLDKAQMEWNILAESLRNAAMAYEEADAAAAESISNGTAMTATATPGGTDAGTDAFALAAVGDEAIEPLPDYYPVRDAAYEIVEPDQGVAFESFATEWVRYRERLIAATDRFRPFEQWHGESTRLVEENMAKHRDWLFTTADLCLKMANQATAVAAAQRWAVPLHPTIEQVEKCDYWWVEYQTNPAWADEWPTNKLILEQNYKNLQDQSTAVLNEYKNMASLPLDPAKPTLPPMSLELPAPEPAGGGGSDDDNPDGDVEDFPTIEDEDETLEDEWSPSAGGASDGSSAVTPDTPTDDETPIEPLPFAPASAVPGPPTGAGIKPASFGGAGGGVPAMPLQPPVGADSASPSAAAAPAAAQPGAGTGTRAPMGAGGMGMPMGGQGAQNQNNKTKRPIGDDESLYKEDRAWTASVIGNRRRNDAPEG